MPVQKHRRFKVSRLSLALGYALAGAGTLHYPAHAQNISTTTSQQDVISEEESHNTPALATVVVTSQKREERLQEVPVPVTAVSGEAIREQNVVLSTDIERLAPNLSAQGGGRTGKPRWFLRGIGTNDPNNNQDGPLSIYVDEVILGYQGNQSFPLFDLERVEVLRGPQGTLWGKNNTGGAIHYISRAPSFDPGGYARLTYGSYNTRIAEAAYGGAIVDDVLAGRVSVYRETYDGWARNIVTGKDGPELEDVNARFQLLANFSDTVDALLIAGTREVEAGNNPSYPVGATTLPGTDVTVLDPDGTIWQGGTPFIPPYGNDPDTYSDFWGGHSKNPTTYNYATLKINWDLWRGHTLTSISAYHERDGETFTSVGVPLNTTLNRTSSIGELKTEQFTQELRLTSPQEQKLSWILGAYYYDLSLSDYSRSARFASGTTSRQHAESKLSQESYSTAIFGNAKYRFNDRLSLTAGLRRTWEEKEIDIRSLTVTGNNNVTFVDENAWYLPGGTILPGTPHAQVNKSRKWTRTTWDITPEYRFNDNLFGYARIATGFRSGGFDRAITNGDIRETDPEYLTDYELGLKSSWLDGRLIVNAAVFHYDIKNLQLNIQRAFYNQTSGTWTTSSAGDTDGEVTGIELEFTAFPTKNWRVGGSLGRLKSEYTNFTYLIGGQGPFDASGNEFYRTPKTSVRLDTDYRIPLAFGNLILATDWSYRSKVYHNATVQTDPLQETPGHWLGNARVSFAPYDRRWELTAFVNNLTDETPVYLRQIANPNTNVQSNSVSAPQTWGVQATVNF